MQQMQCLHLCKSVFAPKQGGLGFLSSNLGNDSTTKAKPKKITLCSSSNNKNRPRPKGKIVVELKGKKGNVWSVDNEKAEEIKAIQNDRRKGRGKMAKMKEHRNKKIVGNIMVSGSMLMEVETVLQTQEPVIKPVWNTFASSVSGIWKGVGAVFSPITAEMEPIDVGSKNENLFDCYTLSHVETASTLSGGQTSSEIWRKINWFTLNPYGELHQHVGGGNGGNERDQDGVGNVLPGFGSFDFEKSDVMEEDVMGHEPGLVFFEDGSYSRGPVDIPVGDVDDSQYYLCPTFKFEQCLVKGCHKRLRMVHTIEFSDGGSDIQILRVAVYEEEWVSPVNLPELSDLKFDVEPFSQRKRTHPSQLTGSWKVFEVSATPIFGEEIVAEDSNGLPFVYLCTETLKKRSLPESAVYFGEEELVDMKDVTVLWLPGGVTGYVDVDKDGILCIGVGWYSDEGINLVMERDYGVDGKLKEVRYKSEVKRRWSDPLPV